MVGFKIIPEHSSSHMHIKSIKFRQNHIKCSLQQFFVYFLMQADCYPVYISHCMCSNSRKKISRIIKLLPAVLFCAFVSSPQAFCIFPVLSCRCLFTITLFHSNIAFPTIIQYYLVIITCFPLYEKTITHHPPNL